MNIADELMKLEELRRQGSLSDEEVVRAREKLLAETRAAESAEGHKARAEGSPDQRITEYAPAPAQGARPPLTPSYAGEPNPIAIPIPVEIQTRLRQELRRGEQVLWVGQPQPWRLVRSTIPTVLAGIALTAFNISWTTGASQFSWGFAAFGLIPFVIGLAMLTSPLWAVVQALRTCYAVTNQRAILWEARWHGAVEIRSYAPQELLNMVRVETGGGVGDLVFEEITTYGRSSKGQQTSSTTKHGFLGIADVRCVQKMILRALLSEDGKEPDPIDESLDCSSPLRRQQKPGRPFWTIALLVLVGVPLLGGATFYLYRLLTDPGPASKSVAILPFEGEDPFDISMAERIEHKLWLQSESVRRTMGAATAESWKSPQQAGKELEVKTVLTGRITRRSDGRRVIQAQLHNVETGKVVWEEEYIDSTRHDPWSYVSDDFKGHAAARIAATLQETRIR